MTRFLFWLGDQIERGVPADRADLTSFETLCYRLSQRIYRAAGLKALTEQERLEWGEAIPPHLGTTEYGSRAQVGVSGGMDIGLCQ